MSYCEQKVDKYKSINAPNIETETTNKYIKLKSSRIMVTPIIFFVTIFINNFEMPF